MCNSCSWEAMADVTSNQESGKRLRSERVRAHLTTRDVEALSEGIAKEKGNEDYYISHAWLTQIEKGMFTPSIYKLYSLSLIYARRYDEILSFFGISLRDAILDQSRLQLPQTRLIGRLEREDKGLVAAEQELRERLTNAPTGLLSRILEQWGGLRYHAPPTRALYGYVGTTDYTLFPYVRPGSFVIIDPQQRGVEAQKWSTEHDRPIFFTELRGGFACSWCELKSTQLVLVPSPQSKAETRQFRFPQDAEIVGRVTGVAMRIV